MIERIHLEILRSTQQCGSLTAAAQQLCLTQSALSHSMRKLEHQLGAVFWQKEGRGLRLTRSGQYLLSVAERLLPQLEHAEQRVRQYAQGQRGILRIGMECHPCYRWLLKVVAPYLTDWPDVDVDVKQQFQFGAVGALFNYEIDVLVTPDPLNKTGLLFKPVFDYEQVLVVAKNHPLANQGYVRAEQLSDQVLITHPVEHERLDVYQQFLMPAKCTPKIHKTIESTDILLQMVANGRGVAALPRWLVNEYAEKIPLTSVSLGEKGIHKQIFLGIRLADEPLDFVRAFFDCAQTV
ncbi:MAG: bacterial regulatory helix-turn-helix, lysR family protein [Burkholderiaceae bacterium]|nr:bacterial regulatory helix-turn-helix, lysR family protein [Burkholderiaceae bacterium]